MISSHKNLLNERETMNNIFCRKKILIMAVMVVFLLGSGAVGAITLEEAKQAALQANLKIKIASEEVSEAVLNRQEVYTDLFATLTVKGSAAYVDNEQTTEIEAAEYGTFPVIGPIPAENIEIATGSNDIYKLSVELEQPLFTGGRIYYSYLGAKAHEEGTRWNERQVVQDILLGVEQAYLSILKAQETEKAVMLHEKSIAAHMEAIEKEHEKGRVAMNDVLKVKVETARSREKVIKAKNDVVITKENLNLLMNRPLYQFVEVEPVQDPEPLKISLREAEDLARANRPEIKQALVKKEEALFSRQVTEADYYPDFSFLAAYTRQTDEPHTEPENWIFMLKMDYPLWDWGGKNHKVNAARAIELQTEYRANEITNQIIFQVRQAWLQVQQADEAIDVAMEAMTQALENVRIVQLGYDHGVNTSTDVLDAEDLLSETRTEYIQAKYDAHFARAVLRYVIGGNELEDAPVSTEEGES
jgi:outer membrane protein TolC